ncbi:hypothetical protein TrLO_g744 [Triparma laevis f. longispina]|uniref:ACB domain-containing protein n=1 Tax=Triparma laevis f. longispina TaxID=1714387 RepID=A0A9W7C535_9STRA|nr:hypothetical protein TrLO_g744 [Triparma laevis f. longispina]
MSSWLSSALSSVDAFLSEEPVTPSRVDGDRVGLEERVDDKVNSTVDSQGQTLVSPSSPPLLPVSQNKFSNTVDSKNVDSLIADISVSLEENKQLNKSINTKLNKNSDQNGDEEEEQEEEQHQQRQQQQRQQQEEFTDAAPHPPPSAPTPPSLPPSTPSSSLTFSRAQATAKTLHNLPNDTKLQIYSTFKCTLGPPTTARPGWTDPVGRAKWDAWSSRSKVLIDKG